MNKFVSVVVPTCNRLSTLRIVLASLLSQSWPDDFYEILVCDSFSTDGTKEYTEGLGIKNVRYLFSELNTRAGARNTGIRHAKGDIILFTDADIIAEKDLILRHMEFHKSEKNIAVVGCEIQVNKYEEIEKVKCGELQKRTLHPDTRKKLSWLYFLTGNASASKEDLINAGGFDEDFSGYGHEDLELGYRLYKSGIEILYNPEAVNYHLHPVGFEEQCKKMHEAGKATVKFYNKHKDPAIKLRLGMTDLSLFLHSVMPDNGWIMKFCRKRVDNAGLCKEIVLQHNYISGIKEALKTGGK